MPDAPPTAQDAAPAEIARKPFVHLHLHSEYSLLDGGNRLDKLVARVAELGMDSVAVTDHGNMHAAVNFYEKARAKGVKPILGVEAYVAPGDRRDRTYTGVSDGGYHLVLLAENETGWENLLHLCSQAYLTGFYFKPRMDRAILAERNSGLIAINGHLGSEMGEHLLNYETDKDKAHYEKAVESARWHAETFCDEGTGPRFFVEMQHHVREQIAINPHLIRIARELDLPLVCDNDSHFLLAEDHDAHDTLICISTGKVKDDESRMRYTPELYVKSPEEMWGIFGAGEYNNERFGDAGREALENTARIADRCNVELPLGANHAPVVIVKAPPKKSLPKHDDASFGGDLTAWFTAFCSAFDLEPATDPDLKQEELKKDCDKALRLLSEAGMVWRYGPRILESKHKFVEGSDEATKRRSDEGVEKEPFDKWARLNRELRILSDKQISAYFLIVWDFVNWGRQRGIPSIARGSGVGTMVGYTLGLSNACPVHYGLLFERFTDPDRSEYPDIDIDLCQDGRGAVIDYVRQKYGHVAQIITFGTLKAKAAIRDVCRVHEVPLSDADKLAKLVPDELKITLDKAMEKEPELKKWYDTDERVRRVIDTGKVLEGQARHASVHAAGVIVATRPLDEVVPLYRQTGAEEHEIVTQWDGPTCERMGLLKMDFLGLRTLSIIERAKGEIRGTLSEEAIWNAVGRTEEFERKHGRSDAATERRSDEGLPTPSRSMPSSLRRSVASSLVSHPLDLERLTYDDPRVFALFHRADTTGVFQFESGGMRKLLIDMKPDRLEDLIAANALFRPGPMDLIPDYNKRKHGDAEVPKVHEIVDRFTAETYGVMVYQEQVMQIVHELGGVPLRSAYSLIKAISKKKHKVIEAERPKFVEGAAGKGLEKKAANELFELILKFAGYGFNKSHSTGYSIVAYQTAYLKTYFPRQFMAAFLSFESQAQKISDWIPYMEDCRKTRTIDPATGEVVSASIDVRPPDVNLSRADFAVVFGDDEPADAAHGHIRFGLKALKGAGSKAIEAIIKERDGATSDKATKGEDHGPISVASSPRRSVASYSSLFDFCERVPPGTVNKATIEALVKSGAFDAVHGRDDRAAMVATIDQAVSAGQKLAADRAAGQGGLFGAGGFGSDDGGGGGGTAVAEMPLVRAGVWSEAETLRQEKDTLGFYVSSHPLEEWKSWTRVFTKDTLAGLSEKGQDHRVMAPMVVQGIRSLIVKSGRSAGQKMAVLTIEDTDGQAEAVLFAGAYAKFGHLCEEDRAAFVMGRVDLSRGDPQIIVDRLVPIEAVPLEQGRLQVVVRSGAGSESGKSSALKLPRVLEAIETSALGVGLDAGEGPRTVEVVVETPDSWVCLEPKRGASAVLRPELVRTIAGVLGEDSVRLVGGVAVEVEEKRKKWG